MTAVAVRPLERRLDLTPMPGTPDERVVACFRAMLGSGELSAVLRAAGTGKTDSSVRVNR